MDSFILVLPLGVWPFLVVVLFVLQGGAVEVGFVGVLLDLVAASLEVDRDLLGIGVADGQ
jgi:hypothetical protein